MIDPRDGLGYALGWTGAAAAALACGYSVALRYQWARVVSMPVWMRAHVVLGLTALACSLLHAGGFGHGNAQMTLVLMLTVSASGTVGRYVKRFPTLHGVWTALHLPLVFVLAGSLAFHIYASFIY